MLRFLFCFQQTLRGTCSWPDTAFGPECTPALCSHLTAHMAGGMKGGEWTGRELRGRPVTDRTRWRRTAGCQLDRAVGSGDRRVLVLLWGWLRRCRGCSKSSLSSAEGLWSSPCLEIPLGVRKWERCKPLFTTYMWLFTFSCVFMHFGGKLGKALSRVVSQTQFFNGSLTLRAFDGIKGTSSNGRVNPCCLEPSFCFTNMQD